MSEWLDIMLSEIARKHEEASAAREEAQRRTENNPNNEGPAEESC